MHGPTCIFWTNLTPFSCSSHFFTNKTYVGGQNVTVDAPLDEFPLFRIVRNAERQD